MDILLSRPCNIPMSSNVLRQNAGRQRILVGFLNGSGFCSRFNDGNYVLSNRQVQAGVPAVRCGHHLLFS